jgi:hypothetical protein
MLVLYVCRETQKHEKSREFCVEAQNSRKSIGTVSNANESGSRVSVLTQLYFNSCYYYIYILIYIYNYIFPLEDGRTTETCSG